MSGGYLCPANWISGRGGLWPGQVSRASLFAYNTARNEAHFSGKPRHPDPGESTRIPQTGRAIRPFWRSYSRMRSELTGFRHVYLLALYTTEPLCIFKRFLQGWTDDRIVATPLAGFPRLVNDAPLSIADGVLENLTTYDGSQVWPPREHSGLLNSRAPTYINSFGSRMSAQVLSRLHRRTSARAD
jgi:hypothetical protein